MSRLPTYAQSNLEVNPKLQDYPQGHRGLWFSRFFDGFGSAWEVDKDARSRWLRQLDGPCGETVAIERAARNQLGRVQALRGQSRVFEIEWKFVTGLGLSHPVENGFSWHPTLGTPYLCGAGVKGLVRAWVETESELGTDDPRLLQWFGDTDQAGSFIFFDAIPIDRPRVGRDVMTPHMGKWYELGGQLPDGGDAKDVYPGDWHSPVPVEFLVTQTAKFLFSIAPRPAAPEAPVQEVLEVLTSALVDLGAGAKTAVGYGSFVPNDRVFAKLEEEMRADREARETEQLLAQMTPIDRRIHELLAEAERKGQNAEILLIAAINQESWSDEDQFKMAQKAKAVMQAGKRWIVGGDPKKNKKIKRTQSVAQLLGEQG